MKKKHYRWNYKKFLSNCLPIIMFVGLITYMIYDLHVNGASYATTNTWKGILELL